MCIGLPLRVLQAWPGGALVAGCGRCERIDTRLVGAVQPAQWLLVFQGAARECISDARAAEIEATLALLQAALDGDAVRAAAEAGFALPSAMDPAALAALTGAPTR